MPPDNQLAATPAAPVVLVVEDEFLIRMTLSEILADEGYSVLEAGSGDEALTLLRGEPAIAILLTDIQLPGSLDGHALARAARAALPQLPVVFMTGRPPSAEDGSSDIGATYVAKPYLPSEICRVVRGLLEPAMPAPG